MTYCIDSTLRKKAHTLVNCCYLHTRTPRSLDRNYMTMVLSSTLALVCMLISAYTCKFARVVEVKTSTQHAIFTEAVAVPTAIGIWRVEGFVVAATEHEKNHNLQSCVAWDHTLWEQNGSIRASKFYAIASTVLGCLLWGLILFGSCHKINGNMLFCLCTLCLMCEALSGRCLPLCRRYHAPKIVVIIMLTHSLFLFCFSSNHYSSIV